MNNALLYLVGPIIVNTDGTTRRIANWDTLSKQEQESSWRLISARNKQRIERLRAQETAMKIEPSSNSTDAENKTME